MKPNRVPDDLIEAAGDAIRAWYAAHPGPNNYLDDRTQMRIVLAAALTLYDQRAEERQRAALDELERLRLFEAAIIEAQVSLQAGAFERGWWKGFNAMPTSGTYTQAFLDTTEYADEIRALNADSAPQQPEHDGTTCAFPGCVHPNHQSERGAEEQR